MPNTWFFMLMALLAGAMMPTQAAINNKLAVYVQHPVLSAFISFAIGTLALLVYIWISGIPAGQLALARQAPLVAWLGGLCGAFFVATVVVVVPRLGVALTFSALIAGQMLVTLPIDHFGFLGVPVKAINWPRILGVLLVAIGVILVRKY